MNFPMGGMMTFGEMEAGPRASGIHLLGIYGPYRCGAWMLVSGKECALVECPLERGASKAVEDARSMIAREGLHLKYIIPTHTHLDHAAGIKAYQKAFPKAKIVGHASFASSWLARYLDAYYTGSTQVLPLGGEPILLMHAPKHSPEDTLVIFRGTCLSGDWIWGRYPEGRNLVPNKVIARTLERVNQVLSESRYHVHTIFSSHANEARRGVDFPSMLSDMHHFFKGLAEAGSGSRSAYS